jgi:flagellar assembly factor FliW
MPQARTKHFALIDYDESAVLTFPAGIPGFEQSTRFLFIADAISAPLVFLQSLDDENVCLPAIAALAVDPDYELSLAGDDLESLGFTDAEQLPAGSAIACFAIVSVPAEGPATANLLAPVVVNLAARRAVQAVRADTRYSHQHPIIAIAPAGDAACS